MSEDLLRSYVERIESLLEARRSISADISDVYAEAKASGFDAPTLRKLIARRAMPPEARAEADALLETYEVAVGMSAGPALRSLVQERPDAAAIALELLTADVVMFEDPAKAQVLVEHVVFLLDLRAEISALRAQEADRRKLAKREGFEVKQLAVTVRWYEKVAKHGLDAMQAGEATFDLYRGTVDAANARDGFETERDKALAAKFAGAGADDGQAKATRARKTRNHHMMLAEMARRARGEG